MTFENSKSHLIYISKSNKKKGKKELKKNDYEIVLRNAQLLKFDLKNVNLHLQVYFFQLWCTHVKRSGDKHDCEKKCETWQTYMI